MRPPSCRRGRTGSSCSTSRQASRTRRTARIAATLDRLARSRGRYGLVLFSDTAYQALPPGTPARELGTFERFFDVPRQTTPGGAPLAPANPWSDQFSAGTRISTGLQLALDVIRARHLGRPGVVLVSDLDDDAGDIEALTNVALAYRKLGIPLRVVGLSPSPEDQRLLTRLLEHPSDLRPAAQARRARGRRRRAVSGATGCLGAGGSGLARAPARAHGATPLGRGMSRRLVAAAAAAAALCAAVVAVVAHDARSWRDALQGGDRSMCMLPPSARWGAETWFPGDPAGLAVHASRDVDLRRAVQMFVVAVHTRHGFDNGESRARARSAAEAALTAVAADAPRAAASQANDLLGVLEALGPRATADELAVASFRAAVRADPSNLDAKLNLELALRRLGATSVRRGPGNGSGPRSNGQRGAGGRNPGSGVLGRGGLGRPALAGRRDRGPRRDLACRVASFSLRTEADGWRTSSGSHPQASGRSDRVQRRRSRSARSSASPLRSRSCRRRGPSTFENRPRCSSSSTSPVRCSHPTDRPDPHDSSAPEASCDIFAGPCPTCRPASQVSPTGSFPTSSQRLMRRRSRTSSAGRSSSRHRRHKRSHATRRASAPLAGVPTSGFFPRSATRRTCVLVTDGETAPYSTADVARALDGRGGCSLLVVQVWAPGERVYGALGKPESAYRPDDAAPTSVRRLAAVTRGQSFDAGQTARAAASLRRHAEVGPTGRAKLVERQRPARPAPRGRRTGACGRARSGDPPAPFGARGAGCIRWCHDRGGPSHVTGLRGRLAAAALLAGVALASLAGGAPGGVATADGDWTSFGRTPANDRHSPLTEITPANVSRLDRAYSVDFQKLDPDVRRGQQSYPLAIGGKLYVTTNDDNVFALDGATGKVIWQYKPPNSALFKNFGIVANRGLAYCDGRLFIAQLDMKLVALRPGDGKVLGVVSISQDVPERVLELRLLGDERADLREPPRPRRRGGLGVRDPRLRDGVHDRPAAGLAEPVLDDPARPPVLAAHVARRRRRRGLDAGDRRLRRRTRSTSAPARRRRCTSRRCGPA